MHYTIESLQEELFQDVYRVYEVFRDFFGEAYTDLQNIPSLERYLPHSINEEFSPIELQEVKSSLAGHQFEILVWWPSVTVTNEHDKSMLIRDLYAKVTIDINGNIPYQCAGFLLNRATFTYDQFISRYIHSHIPPFSEVPHFSRPCLGTGPLNQTVLELKNNSDSLTWMLFCQELSLYVTVESLHGVPYIRLESLGASVVSSEYSGAFSSNSLASNTVWIRAFRRVGESRGDTLAKEKYLDFIKWYLKNGHLSFTFQNDKFQCGMPYYDYIIDVSNAFIAWFNLKGSPEEVERLYRYPGLLRQVKVSQGKFYRYDSNRTINFREHEGEVLFTFKGRNICLHVTENAEAELTPILLLENSTAMAILDSILYTVNYRFTNDYTRLPETGSVQENTSSTYQKVIYL